MKQLKSKMALTAFMLLLTATFAPTMLFAQEEIKTEVPDSTEREKYVIRLNNGREHVGYIIEDDGREVKFESLKVGIIFIKKTDISTMKPVNKKETVQLEDGSFRFSGPFTTRYHLTTNALPIKKGENYALLRGVGPEVHFALTDRMSVGIMTTWVAAPLILALKYTIPTKDPKLNFGIGSLLGSSTIIDGFQAGGGLLWGMATYGDRFNNVTLSLGYSYIGMTNRTVSRLPPGKYPYTWSGGIPISSLPPFENAEVTHKQYAPVIGVGTSLKVGNKASLIIDGIIYQGKENLGNTDVDFYYDNQGNAQGHEVKPVITDRQIIVLMPGMRFQPLENQAFQVTLGTFSQRRNGEDPLYFPLPMFAWFAKF